MNTADSNVTDMNILQYHKTFFVVLCIIHRRSFLSFPHLIIHPIQEWSGSWRHFQFCFVVSNDELLWHCSSSRADKGCHRSIMSFCFFQNNVLGLLMRETWLELVCSCPRGDNGCPRSIIHQFISFPLLRRQSFVIVPSLCSVLSTRHGRQRVAPFYHISQLSHSRDSDIHNFFSGLSDAEDDRVEGALAIKLIIGLDFAVTLSSPDSSCVLFDITWEQTVELKWLMINKHKRWFHSSRVKFPLVSMSASWFLVSMYLIWILGCRLTRSNNQSSATLWVLETCLTVGLLPLKFILITASLSSNTYNKTSWWEDWTFEGTKPTLSKSLITLRECVCESWEVGNKFHLCSQRVSPFYHGSESVFPRTDTIRSH